MKYQIAFFNPSAECWHFYREDFKVVQFEDFAAAEAKARSMGDSWGREVLVITVHVGFRAEHQYRLVHIEHDERAKRFTLDDPNGQLVAGSERTR